jgi:hypothetical protein
MRGLPVPESWTQLTPRSLPFRLDPDPIVADPLGLADVRL